MKFLDLGKFVIDHGQTLIQLAGLLLALFTLPLAWLAWGRRVYPHVPLVIALAIPCTLTMAFLLESVLPFLFAQNHILLSIVIFSDLLLLVVSVIDLLTLPRARSFVVERETTRVASLQKDHRVQLHISNKSRRWLLAWIRDDIPPEFTASPQDFILRLGPESRTSVHYDLVPARRGAFSLEKVYVRVRSWLGLWRRIIEIPVQSAIHVYPDMKQLSEYAILARTNRLSLMGMRRTRKVGGENDFERLRDYTQDDNYRFMDWRATARRNKLTVKDFQTSQSQRIIFLIDCGRLMTNESGGLSLLDHSLNAVLMLSYVALQKGDSVGMVCFSDKILSFVPPKGGMTQMNQLLHASFDRFPQMVESRYDEAFLHLATHVKKRSLVVMISNVIDEVNANQIQSYLGTLVGKHLPLGVLLRDHQLFDAADVPPFNEAALYRGAAAAEILLWRHQVLKDLEHQGVLMLDLFPEDMTAPLVNSYLNIKARHLL